MIYSKKWPWRKKCYLGAGVLDAVATLAPDPAGPTNGMVAQHLLLQTMLGQWRHVFSLLFDLLNKPKQWRKKSFKNIKAVQIYFDAGTEIIEKFINERTVRRGKWTTGVPTDGRGPQAKKKKRREREMNYSLPPDGWGTHAKKKGGERTIASSPMDGAHMPPPGEGEINHRSPHKWMKPTCKNKIGWG